MTLEHVGLIINPMAGIGGTVGLKGSDGLSIQRQAIALGAKPVANRRALIAMRELSSMAFDVSLVVYPGEMGEGVARACGFEPRVIGEIELGNTTARDTQHAATEMKELGVRLILFAGGDGTARDISAALGTQVPVVGIPAGVKMHSAAFTNRPSDAGDLVRLVLEGRVTRYREAEVMDLDEESYRRGIMAPKLYGFLKVPIATGLVQSLKMPSRSNEIEAQEAIARWVCEGIESGCLYILGPGTTTRAIANYLGVEKTLIGIDVVMDGQLIQSDANEDQLLRLLNGQKAKIVVSPIGGQGHLFGRGNQQISHRVITRVGNQNILAVCTPDKLHSLMGRPLRVDISRETSDVKFPGYVHVVTGYNEQAVYRVAS